jgi:hypothetical protein
MVFAPGPSITKIIELGFEDIVTITCWEQNKSKDIKD